MTKFKLYHLLLGCFVIILLTGMFHYSYLYFQTVNDFKTLQSEVMSFGHGILGMPQINVFFMLMFALILYKILSENSLLTLVRMNRKKYIAKQIKQIIKAASYFSTIFILVWVVLLLLICDWRLLFLESGMIVLIPLLVFLILHYSIGGLIFIAFYNSIKNKSFAIIVVPVIYIILFFVEVMTGYRSFSFLIFEYNNIFPNSNSIDLSLIISIVLKYVAIIVLFSTINVILFRKRDVIE